MEFLLQTQESFGGFVCLKFHILQCFKVNRIFEALSFDFQLIKLEIGMYFCECVSECVSVNASVAFEFLTRNPT